jgi:hypothetical protein
MGSVRLSENRRYGFAHLTITLLELDARRAKRKNILRRIVSSGSILRL